MPTGNDCPLCGAKHPLDDGRRKNPDDKAESLTWQTAKFRSRLADYVVSKITATQLSEAESVLRKLESILGQAEMGVL